MSRIYLSSGSYVMGVEPNQTGHISVPLPAYSEIVTYNQQAISIVFIYCRHSQQELSLHYSFTVSFRNTFPLRVGGEALPVTGNPLLMVDNMKCVEE